MFGISRAKVDMFGIIGRKVEKFGISRAKVDMFGIIGRKVEKFGISVIKVDFVGHNKGKMYTCLA
jgi:hypothetical protein